MALVIKDRIKETTTTTGTSTYSLAGAESGFQGFSAVGDGNTCYYACTDNTDFEVGIGTFTASGSTLARTTILESSNSDAAVDWSAGTKDIFVTYPADKAVFKDASGNVSGVGTLNATNVVASNLMQANAITLTGSIGVSVTENIIFEGSTADNYETFFTATDPTADRTITLPDAAGTVALTTDINATNVTAAGALMDSEVTNLAQVKAFDSSDYATAAQGSTADAAMPTSGGTFTGDVTILNTGDGSGRAPDFNLKRDSASPAAWDYLGAVRFLGEDGASNETPYGSILGRIVDPTSGSEDGRLEIWQQKAGTGTLTYVFDHDKFQLTNEQPIRWDKHLSTDYDVDLIPATPTADQTITLPDETGTVLLQNSTTGLFNITASTSGTSSFYSSGGFHYIAVKNSVSGSGSNSGLIMGASTSGDAIIAQRISQGGSIIFNTEDSGGVYAGRVKIGDTALSLDQNMKLVFEGATANDYETTVTVTDPTADRTITLPDQTGTAMLWQSAWPDDPTENSIAIGNNALINANSSAVRNTVVGYDAGDAITSGERNSLIGDNAGSLLTTGSFCTAVGQNAMGQNTTDSNTTAIGALSGGGDFLLGGTYVGSYAGNYNSNHKDYQTAIGYLAMNDCSGDYSVAVGTSAMSDGVHYRSVGVGYYALGNTSTWYPYYNVAVGSFAGNNAYSGDHNTVMGYNADLIGSGTSYAVAVGSNCDTAGNYSVSMGYEASGSSTGGSDYCVLIGPYAGFDMDGGDQCTFIGNNAGYAGGSGSFNTTVGTNSLRNLTSGGYNSALGNLCLYRVETGEYNSSLGNKAGHNVTTGSNNTFVGHNAGYIQDNYATTALDTGSNVTCLGYEAVPSSTTATNEITLGDNDITSLRCNVQTISSLSDERDKTAIKDLTFGLDFINDMRPVEFTWNRRDGSLGAKTDMGFIAQELYDVELDHSSSSRTRLVNWENPEKLEADYVRSYPILVKAVQELSAQVTALQARIETLEGN